MHKNATASPSAYIPILYPPVYIQFSHRGIKCNLCLEEAKWLIRRQWSDEDEAEDGSK